MVSTFISKVSFEMLVCTMSSEDIIVPTGGIINKSDKKDIFLEINTLSKQNYIKANDDKIEVSEKAKKLVGPIVSAKFIAAIDFGDENRIFETIYYSDDSVYTVVENCFNRPAMVKISAYDYSELCEHIDELIYRINKKSVDSESKASIKESCKSISDLVDERILFDTRIMFRSRMEVLLRILVAENKSGLVVLATNNDGEILKTAPYSAGSFVDFINQTVVAEKEKISIELF